MKALIAWFARNSVAANLLVLVLLIGGAMTIPRVKKEVFPEMALDNVTVTVVYPGAAPADVEEAICIKVEEAIAGLDGVKRIYSTASEGVGVVTVEVREDADVRTVLDDVKARVDSIDTFPKETERPIVQETVFRAQVLNIAIAGPMAERDLRRLAEQVRDEVSSLPAISEVTLGFVRPFEIALEVSEGDLRRHGLTLSDVIRAVQSRSLDLPGGSIKTAGGEILLRTKGQAYDGTDFAQIPLVTRDDGSRVTLGDVATVRDGFEEASRTARFGGHPTAMVQVFRVGDQSALDISDTIERYLATAQPRMPEGVSLTIWQDDSEILRGRMDLLLRNAAQGLMLVLIVLALFLRLRLAFWVAVGIPVCFLGTMMFLPVMDVSLNLISLFGFILVLGIVVDDAIVVAERIHHYQKLGMSSLAAAIKGAREVSIPVAFAVTTSIVAFTPILGIPGANGRIWRQIPIVVILTLGFSLVESLLILPAHLAHKKRVDRLAADAGTAPAHDLTPHQEKRHALWNPLRWVDEVQRFMDRRVDWFLKRVYQPFIDFCLRWRYATLAWGFGTLILVVGILGAGIVQFVFFPPVEADTVSTRLTMPLGTPFETTKREVAYIEVKARELEAELTQLNGGTTPFRHIFTTVGEHPIRMIEESSVDGFGGAGSHMGGVMIELMASEERTLSSDEIARRWREKVGQIPDAVSLAYKSSIASVGDPINIQLAGPNLDHLQAATAELKAKLAEYPGVFDISDSFRAGKQEVRLSIKPSAEALGLTMADLATQVRQGFHGEKVQTVQRGRNDVEVYVRYPEEERRTLSDLENMRIRTPDGREVPFKAVATADMSRGYASIQRTDRRRAINVTGDVDLATGNPNVILADVTETFLPSLLAKYPGLTATFEGEQREQADTLAALSIGGIIAGFVIFALLAVPLRSYYQPALIMFAIPFGVVGAVLGHLFTGVTFSILSVCGVIALAGVVVNDSLVLVDQINMHRREGASLQRAVRNAGAMRFRAVWLTSMTTFAGLTPLMLERSVQAKFLIPMAVALAYGVMFSTFTTLVLLPAAYMVLADIQRFFGMRETHAEEDDGEAIEDEIQTYERGVREHERAQRAREDAAVPTDPAPGAAETTALYTRTADTEFGAREWHESDAGSPFGTIDAEALVDGHAQPGDFPHAQPVGTISAVDEEDLVAARQAAPRAAPEAPPSARPTAPLRRDTAVTTLPTSQLDPDGNA